MGKGHSILYSCHQFALIARQCFLPSWMWGGSNTILRLCAILREASRHQVVLSTELSYLLSLEDHWVAAEFSSWICSQLGAVTLRSAFKKKQQNNKTKHWTHEPVKRDLMISHVVFVSLVCIYCSLLWPTKISRRRKNRLLNNLTGGI